MKTEHALRYLLLRHLKRREGTVAHDRFLEVTRSLHVGLEHAAFVVTWRAGGATHVRRFARQAFAFYTRGDLEQGAVDADLRTDNDALAERFADEVLGSDTRPNRAGPAEAAEPFPLLEWIDAVVFAAALATVGRLGLATGLGLFAVRAADLVPKGRLAGTLGLLLLAALGPPVAAILAAVACTALQAIDPNPERRGACLGICVGALVAAGVRLGMEPTALRVDLWLVALLAAVVVLVILRALHGGHFQVLPLILPFYTLGLYVDGHPAASLLGLALLLASTIVSAYGHRWVPVQRERVLTPNG